MGQGAGDVLPTDQIGRNLPTDAGAGTRVGLGRKVSQQMHQVQGLTVYTLLILKLLNDLSVRIFLGVQSGDRSDIGKRLSRPSRVQAVADDPDITSCPCGGITP